MYKITAHIKRLLIEYDKVIVPGLGVFGLNYVPASIENGQIIPPSKQLYFDDTLYPNDGLLIRSIIRSEQLNYVSANTLIEKEVSFLRKDIENSPIKSIYLEGLGELQQTTAGTLCLKTSYSHSFFIDGYGYATISLQPVLPLSQLPEKQTPYEKDACIEISLRKDFIHKIATIAAILLLILIFPAKIENGNISTDYAGFIPPVITTQEKNDADIIESGSIPTQTENTTEQETTVADTIFQKQYHIIIASLPSRETAQLEIERFARNGISPLTIIERDNKARLSIRYFNTIEEASAFSDKLKKTHPELSDAWILTVR